MMRWWIGTRLHELFPLIPFSRNTHHQVCLSQKHNLQPIPSPLNQ